MKKLLALLKYAAIGFGAFLFLGAVLAGSSPPGVRLAIAIVGISFAAAVFVPLVRRLLFIFASFLLICALVYSIPSNSGGALVILFIAIAGLLAFGVYNGYKVFVTVRNSRFAAMLRRMLRRSEIPIEPAICTAQPVQTPPSVRPATYEDVQALKALRRLRSDPPVPRPDIRDSYAVYGGTDAEMLTIDFMEGHDFEYWCANALRDIGFEDVEVTPGSGDQGVDILAAKDGLRYAIQCKRYTADLGNTPVQEVHSGKYFYRCHVAAVITNRYFTPGAKELAAATGVLLWDRDWILRYLQTKQSPDGALLISHAPSAPPPMEAELDIDEILPAAIDVILETGQASVSILQRRLNLDYARCARLIDEMEDLGLIGPFSGIAPRVILITRVQWEAMRSGDL